MLEILFDLVGSIRQVFIMIDSVVFSLIGTAYDLIYTFASASLIKEEVIITVMNNLYVVIGIFALFRIALLLVNAMINPDKLTEKENGIGNILTNLIIMFVLLIMTPWLFTQAFELQSEIVGKAYIQKMFIKGDTNQMNPGEQMKKIAVQALITIDNEVLKSGKNCDRGGNSKCSKAIDDYETMMKNGNNVSFSTLRNHIGVSVDTANEKDVYVYNYTMILTLLAGGFIAYILFSFAIDIAVRSVEMVVLEIIAPLFIVTIVDPKSAKSGPFHNWLKTLGKTYASLFIKIAIVSLMLLLIKLMDSKYLNIEGIKGMSKLLLLFAILIFAKKAPKWIGDMIGIGDEGLGGLGIGKKLAGAALIGGALNKTKHAMAGAGLGALRKGIGFANAKRATHKAEGKTASSRFRSSLPEKDRSFGDYLRAAKGTYFNKEQAKKNIVQGAKNTLGTFGAGMAGMLTGAVAGSKTGFGSENTKDINSKLKAEQKEIEKDAGYESIIGRLGTGINNATGKIETKALGSVAQRKEMREKLEKKALAEKMLGQRLEMDYKTGDLYDSRIPTNLNPPALESWKAEHLVAFDDKSIKKRYGSTVNGIEDVIASTITGGKNAHFISSEIRGQEYIDPTDSSRVITTGVIPEGALVKDKVVNGRIVYDKDGNAVKEAVTDSSGRVITRTETAIKNAINAYNEAAKDKTGSTPYESVIEIPGMGKKKIKLTGQGVLEYEAAFASIKDESAKAFVSINDKKGEVSKQLADLQANLAATRHNLEASFLDTEYSKVENRKKSLLDELSRGEALNKQYNSAIISIQKEIKDTYDKITIARSKGTQDGEREARQLEVVLANKKAQKDTLVSQKQNITINNDALKRNISDCDVRLTDPVVISEKNRVEAEMNSKTKDIETRINDLLKQNVEYERELETYISYGNSLEDKDIGKLSMANADRFLQSTEKAKSKTRENADTYASDGKKDDSKK